MSEDLEVLSTGASRSQGEGKLQYAGYESPLVTNAFAQYMRAHQYQKDGKIRAADNWQQGIPLNRYLDSLVRHVMDLQLAHAGFWKLTALYQENPEFSEADLITETLCAIRFNVSGYLFEVLLEKGDLKRAPSLYQLGQEVDPRTFSHARAVPPDARFGQTGDAPIVDGVPDYGFNGGVKCDMLLGPCACGGWHSRTERMEKGFKDFTGWEAWYTREDHAKEAHEKMERIRSKEPDYFCECEYCTWIRRMRFDA